MNSSDDLHPHDRDDRTSTMANHTPGPWAINHDINALNVCRGEPFTDIGLCFGADGTGSTPGLEEGRANARLLSAAPEMLDVCVAIHEMGGCNKHDNGALWESLENAIVKAMGGI